MRSLENLNQATNTNIYIHAYTRCGSHKFGDVSVCLAAQIRREIVC